MLCMKWVIQRINPFNDSMHLNNMVYQKVFFKDLPPIWCKVQGEHQKH